MARLKMWCGLRLRRTGESWDGPEHVKQAHCKVVAKSQTRAAELLGVNIGEVTNYWYVDRRPPLPEEGVWQAAKHHMPKWPEDYNRVLSGAGKC